MNFYYTMQVPKRNIMPTVLQNYILGKHYLCKLHMPLKLDKHSNDNFLYF